MSNKDNVGKENGNNPLTLLIRTDQLSAQRRNILAAVPVNLAVAAIAFLVSIHSNHGRQGLAWFGAVCITNALRIFQAWPAISQKIKETPQLNLRETQRALNQLCLTALLSGLVWSLVPVLCDGYTSRPTLFYLTIVCGITAGAITHGTPYALMPSSFILPPLLSLFGCLLYFGGFNRDALALTVFIYGAALIRFAWQSEKAFCETSLLKNRAVGLAGSLEEARSQAVLAAQEMSHRATHDDLTGLLNRAGFLREIAGRISTGSTPFCLMLLDIDGFNSINDTFGHHSGDRVVIEIARRISETLHGGFTIGRLGADEFAIFHDAQTTDTSPAELATRLLTAVAMPLASFDAGRLSACIGLHTGNERNVTEQLSRANEALLAAKSAGRGQFRCFDERLRARLKMRRDIERNLRRALEDSEPEIWYQPIFGYDGQKLVSFEALLRWDHPEHGPIPPQEIIATAALSGLAEPLLRYILSSVCLMIQELRARGLTQMRVAINISPREISHLAIDEILLSELARHDCPTSMLEVEITEETALDIRSVQDKLIRLAHRGVQISIDDFGVGYATLATLRQSYVNKIKIDQSFVKDLAKSHGNQILVQSILNLGQSLGLQVVAEGVETKDDATCLRRLGCGLLQGHYLLPPVRLGAMLERLGLHQQS
ncbi:MAG: EAL domain-containing protein [Rhodospirillales bacterium]|nr:EAL domain-containing protein [Rhodospirillales bacterium]